VSADVMTAGTDRFLDFTLTDPEDGSISGGVITFWVGPNRLSEGSDRLIEKSSTDTDEIEILNAAERRFRVKLVPADTVDLDEGQYHMEAKLALGGFVYKPVTGSLFIETAPP
jgi:hypothetical protein